MMMITFLVHLKKAGQPVLHDLEKSRNPDLASMFQATMGEKFTPINILRNDNVAIDGTITAYNTNIVGYLGRNVA